MIFKNKAGERVELHALAKELCSYTKLKPVNNSYRRTMKVFTVKTQDFLNEYEQDNWVTVI